MIIEGDLDHQQATALAAAFAMRTDQGAELRVEMDTLELEDGVSVAEMINGLRALLSRWEQLTLVEAPQMLAHTLYKVGMLRSGRIVLIDPREDQGTTAN